MDVTSETTIENLKVRRMNRVPFHHSSSILLKIQYLVPLHPSRYVGVGVEISPIEHKGYASSGKSSIFVFTDVLLLTHGM